MRKVVFSFFFLLIFIGYIYPQGGSTLIRRAELGDSTAVLRTLVHAHTYLNVKTDFGAVGDGTTDDTEAFQNALDYLNVDNTQSSDVYEIIVPVGVYKITRTLFYEGDNGISLFLTGEAFSRGEENATLKWYGKAKGTMLVILGANHSHFKNITIVGSSVDSTAVGSYNIGIWVNATNSHDSEPTVDVSTFTLTSNVATVVTSSAHSLSATETVKLAGLSTSAYNGRYLVDTVLSSTSFRVSYFGSNGSATGGTATRVQSTGSSGVNLSNLQFLQGPVGYHSTGILIANNDNPPGTCQVSELEFSEIHFWGGQASSYAGIRTLASGNTKNFIFHNIDCYGYDYLMDFRGGGAGTVTIDKCGSSLTRESLFYLADAVYLITNCSSESPDSKFIEGTGRGKVTIIGCSIEGSCDETDVLIDYSNGYIVLINNVFANTRTATSIPKIYCGDVGLSDTPSFIYSIGNTYTNAIDYAPFYGGGGTIPMFGSGTSSAWNNVGITATSVNDQGGLNWTTPLKPVTSFETIRSTDTLIATLGFVRMSKSDSLMFRNEANTDDIVGMYKDTTNKIILGDEDGVIVRKIDIVSMPIDTVDLIAGQLYADENTGLVNYLIPQNLVVNGKFDDWTGANKNQFPDSWLVSPVIDTAHDYCEESPTGKLHYVTDGYYGGANKIIIFQGQTLLPLGESYKYSFNVTEVTDSFYVVVAGNYFTITAVGIYSGEVTSTDEALVGFMHLDGAASITIDDIRVWASNNGDIQSLTDDWNSRNIFNLDSLEVTGTAEIDTLIVNTYTISGALDLTGTGRIDLPNYNNMSLDSSITRLGKLDRVIFNAPINNATGADYSNTTYIDTALTINWISVVLRTDGGANDSVDINLYWAADISSGSPATLWSADKTIGSATTGQFYATFSDATIPENVWVWAQCNRLVGTVTQINITAKGRND